MNPDIRSFNSDDNVIRIEERLGGPRSPGPPLEPPGGGDGGMEARIKRLEEDVKEIRLDLDLDLDRGLRRQIARLRRKYSGSRLWRSSMTLSLRNPRSSLMLRRWAATLFVGAVVGLFFSSIVVRLLLLERMPHTRGLIPGHDIALANHGKEVFISASQSSFIFNITVLMFTFIFLGGIIFISLATSVSIVGHRPFVRVTRRSAIQEFEPFGVLVVLMGAAVVIASVLTLPK